MWSCSFSLISQQLSPSYEGTPPTYRIQRAAPSDCSNDFGIDHRSQRLTVKKGSRGGKNGWLSSVQLSLHGPEIDTSRSAGAVLQKSWLEQEALGYNVKQWKRPKSALKKELLQWWGEWRIHHEEKEIMISPKDPESSQEAPQKGNSRRSHGKIPAAGCAWPC